MYRKNGIMDDRCCWGFLAPFNVIKFFSESDFIESLNQYRCFYIFDPNVIFILSTVNSVLYSFGPAAIIFITNFVIVFKFMRAKCKSNSTESTNQALAKFATRGDSNGGHCFHYISNSHGTHCCEPGTVAQH